MLGKKSNALAGEKLKCIIPGARLFLTESTYYRVSSLQFSREGSLATES